MVNDSAASAAPPPAGPCDDSVEELATNLFTVARVLQSILHRNLANRGLRRGDTALLRALADRGPMRPGQLASHLGIGASAVSRQLATLAETALVSRYSDPDDRRAEIVEITDEGQARLAELKQMYVAVMREYFGDWAPEQMRDATEVLRALADSMNNKNLGDAAAALQTKGER